jgi:hypothetical protein
MLKSQTNRGIEVFCYVSKSEVERSFEERKQLVCEIYEKAMECERERNITDALKYYYFSIILMNSIPTKAVECQSKNLIVEIPARINSVVANTKCLFLSDKKLSNEREIELKILYNNEPIQQLDFSFWDGSSQVHVRAVDGTGVFKLYGGSMMFDKLNIEIKYNYYESREEILEVKELWGLVLKPTFRNSQTVNLSRMPVQPPAPRPLREKFVINLANTDRSPVAQTVTDETRKFVYALDSKNAETIRTTYSTDKFLIEKITGLLRYNSPELIDDTIRADIHKTITGWEVRKLRVLTFYPSLNRQMGEYLILDFDSTGKFEDVNFGTVHQLYETFVSQGQYGNDWGNRQVIVKFVERYRTAFLTRNMAMLDTMFADEAVIIIGRVIKKTSLKGQYTYARVDESQPDVVYTQYTKNQYLKNQKKNFEAHKDISLGFSTFKINRKNDAIGTYGISMKQNYTATGYADEGYLFLLVDFLQTQPQIYVRSWQPREWSDKAMIGLANFRLNR